MKASDAFPSRFMSSADIRATGRDIIDTIESIQMEDLESQDKKDRKPVVYLRNNKPLILNRTNWDILVGLLGADDCDDWRGAKIQIGVEKVRFGRDMVDGLRIKNARLAGQAANKPQPAPQQPPPNEPPPATSAAEFGLGDDINDDIPF